MAGRGHRGWIAWGAAALLPAGPLAAQQATLSDLVLDPVSDGQGLRYARALFPADADPADASGATELAPGDRAVLESALKATYDHLAVEVWQANRASVLAMLRAEGVAVPAQPAVPPAGLEVLEGPQAVAAAGNDGRIAISAVTLRGFLLGAFRSAGGENTSEGRMLGEALGWPRTLGGDDAAWAGRIGTLLDLADRLPPLTLSPAVQRQANAEMIRDEQQPPTPPYVDALAQRVLERGEPPTPVDAYRVNVALFFLTTQLNGPAQRFLLAHELGHLVLRHAYRTDCAGAARQERDADAFAVALLTYDFLGGDVDLLALNPDQTANERGAVDVRRAKYGYLQAFRYGMASAGMRGDPAAACPFMPGDERLARTDAFELAMARRRFAALASLLRYAQAHPSVVATAQTEAPMDAEEKDAFGGAARVRCNGAPARLVHFAGQARFGQKQHVYFVKCAWPAPTLAEVPEADRVLIGAQLYGWVMGSYADGGTRESERL